ncbi:MAG: response regulator, partial [Lachnospiraceae bacterium]|nr:response regulator [Lachnospiraceae bacterium]
AKDKGLEFNVNVDPALPDILYGDEMRIRQVVTNILNNAVKYTDKGSVTLTVSGGSGYTNEEGQTLELTFAVRDTGIGIKEEDRSRLFGKFERMDLEHNSTVEGTGLGLAITKRLLTMMDGTIDVDSEYGKGSVFTIRIPQRIVKNEPIGNFREKFEKSLEEASDTDLIFKAPDAYILIVDDTRMNLNVAVGLLRDTDIRVDTAESGAEAIKLAASNSYDMILLDQRMPEMDGTETLHRMREMEKLAGTPIICLTADAISGARERYVEEGFNDYLSKPIDILALMKMLMNYLPKEKIIPITSEDTLPDTSSDLSTEKTGALYKKLEAAGINTSQGLSFCANDSEFYEEMLCTYLDAAGTRKNELESAIASEDLHTYAIKVHALKSTSRTIGAEELSEMAAALERAANAGNAAEVKTGHAGLMKKYGETVDAISSAGLSGQSQTKEDSDDVLEFSPN